MNHILIIMGRTNSFFKSSSYNPMVLPIVVYKRYEIHGVGSSS